MIPGSHSPCGLYRRTAGHLVPVAATSRPPELSDLIPLVELPERTAGTQ